MLTSMITSNFFDNRPQYFTAVAGSTEGDYNVAFTTIQLDVDYNLHKKFYISLAG